MDSVLLAVVLKYKDLMLANVCLVTHPASQGATQDVPTFVGMKELEKLMWILVQSLCHFLCLKLLSCGESVSLSANDRTVTLLLCANTVSNAILLALCADFFSKDRTGHKAYKADVYAVASRTKILLCSSVGPVIVIYCCTALNCRESCQLANTKQERTEVLTKMAFTVRERFDFRAFLLFLLS